MTEEESIYRNLVGDSWFPRLKDVLFSPYFAELGAVIKKQRERSTIIPDDIKLSFRAFRETPFDTLKVVIIGQDPYHDEGRFDGLAFSNGNLMDSNGIQKRESPSLKNILDEVESDVYGGMILDREFDLTRWAKQGVLLLNTALTVPVGTPGAHIELWKPFIKEVFRTLQYQSGIIYMLWGAHANKYRELIIEKSNHILSAGHPSPLNTANPFKGCRHFSKANKLLREMNGDDYAIEW
jgi:uracil-DNA glycosylase